MMEKLIDNCVKNNPVSFFYAEKRHVDIDCLVDRVRGFVLLLLFISHFGSCT